MHHFHLLDRFQRILIETPVQVIAAVTLLLSHLKANSFQFYLNSKIFKFEIFKRLARLLLPDYLHFDEIIFIFLFVLRRRNRFWLVLGGLVGGRCQMPRVAAKVELTWQSQTAIYGPNGHYRWSGAGRLQRHSKMEQHKPKINWKSFSFSISSFSFLPAIIYFFFSEANVFFRDPMPRLRPVTCLHSFKTIKLNFFKLKSGNSVNIATWRTGDGQVNGSPRGWNVRYLDHHN